MLKAVMFVADAVILNADEQEKVEQ